MYKRRMGKLPVEVSLLGFGCMRLPTLDNGEIDEKEALKIIHYAMDNGVNYLDTAYNYHGGTSESLVGKAIQGRDVHVATKLPLWLVEDLGDAEKIFAEQLENLGTKQIDFYLLHALNLEFWKKAKRLKVLEFLEECREKGLIKYLGFSFHDSLQVFQEIVDGYTWDFCQIQYNYMDENYQAGVAGLRYAVKQGLGVIVMEPLRGGRLVRNIPKEIENVFSQAPKKRTPAEWAFRWVANHGEVSLILSGMGSLKEVQENMATMKEAQANSLSLEELAVINSAKEFYNDRLQVKCTDCKYCLPCPEGVDIPRIFDLYNNASIYNTFSTERQSYAFLIEKAQDAGHCVACGQCEDVCPQNLKIIDTLQKAHNALM